MRSVEEHAKVVASLLPPTGAEDIPVGESVGRVLARDVLAPLSLPPFANSAMDGYAVRAADLSELPAVLPVAQDIPAGLRDVHPLEPGTASRIMTGAPVPDGADTIVPVEWTDGGVDRVRIDDIPPIGRHVRPIGEDVAAGDLLLRAGTVIGAAQLGVLAAVGTVTVSVRCRPRVLVLSTGSELVEPGRPLEPGEIYESNSGMLAAAVDEAGGKATVVRFVEDDVETFLTRLTVAADGFDLVLTSGGVSAGAYEVVKDAFTGRGVEFAKVGMQPGMPQGAGVVEFGGVRVPVVTLPGNPVSAYVSFEVFVRPALRAALGHSHPHRPVRRLPLTAALESPLGKRQFRRGVLDESGVAPWGGPGSHLLAWLAGADAMIVVPEQIDSLSPGDDVEVWLLG